MVFQEIKPSPILQPLVRNYLIVNFPPSIGNITPYPTRIEQTLAFFARGFIHSYNFDSGEKSKIARNALFGQQVGRLNFDTHYESDFLMIMVIFQPGAMYRLLGFSNQELTTQFTDAEMILGNELQNVNDQIANAHTYREMIEHIEEYLMKKLKRIKQDIHGVDKIAQLLLTNPTGYSLDWLANQAYLSPRQFERKFSERMGIGPKLYSRINRFYQAYQCKEAHVDRDWLTIALDFGYTDYNHLVKDFKQFAQVTPNILLKQRSMSPEIMVLLNQY